MQKNWFSAVYWIYLKGKEGIAMQLKKQARIIEEFTGKIVKVYYSVVDPVSFTEGILKNYANDRRLIRSEKVMVFIPWSFIVCFESNQ